MNELILHPTATAQWHALVKEASHKHKITLSEEVESYLVFLLMRFTSSTTLLHKVMALEFLASLQQSNNTKQQMLQTVGDSCLLFSGLFPGCARRRRVRISYYIKLGQTAYASLSEQTEQGLATLFTALCDHFVPLMDTLQFMRELQNTQQSLDFLQAEELWNDAKGKYALQILKKSTNATFLFNTQLISNTRH
jgi:hypothetical protein